jgi:putative peptidoglycan lipid II flippase
MGVVRTRVFSFYFGQASIPADAFNAALRIPNLLVNLFGEGALSASFIPVYSRLLAQGDEKEAGRFAGAIAAILSLAVTILVLLGVLAAPLIVKVVAGGYHGAERELTTRLVRILFPATGLLTLSAWCLGVLNSHRQFLLAYSAPIVWNIAMIAALLLFGGRTTESDLAIRQAWASVVGSALMVLVQLPVVLRLGKHFVFRFNTGSAQVRETVSNFVPVFFSRGVVQISAFVDTAFATSLSAVGSPTALANAQLLYTLPVSLFGMAVSAAELPAMSSMLGTKEEVAAYLNTRISRGLRRLAFFVVPSSMAFLSLGNVLSGIIFQTGAFRRQDSETLWAVVAGSAVGLLASTMGRLYSSTFYALRDTRTPLNFAIVRVTLTAGLGWLCAFRLPPLLGLDPRFWVAGLTASAGVAGWVEFALLRSALNKRIGPTGLPPVLAVKLWLSAAVAAAAAWAVKPVIGLEHPLRGGFVIVGVYGIVYFAVTYLLGIEECAELLNQVRRRLRR